MMRPMDDLEKGTIKFVQNYLPALEGGDYTLTVEQNVASADGKVPREDLPTTTKRFYVRAERFRFHPNEVVTRFPPPDSQGDFRTVLPHIVFKTGILPWARTPDPNGNPQTDGLGNRSSWLALLLFDQADPPPPLVNRTLADLVTQGDTISYFQNTPHWEPGESGGERCTTIDIPGKLFNQILPSNDDLYYVASAREVLKGAGGQGGTPYSVVMGSRLAVKGHRATVHLVSLEGLAAYLPGSGGQGKVTQNQTVRLVSLTHWSFDALNETYSFKKLMAGLNKTPANLQIPNPNPLNGKTATGELGRALPEGYCAMTHHMRQGSQTVSWYRGPLVPFALTQTDQGPIFAADKLLRYNPDTGLFDTSYAAAWQLGQLLALQNKGYATALYDWKRQAKLKSVAAQVVASIQNRFGKAIQLQGPGGLTRQNMVSQSTAFVKNVLKPYLTPSPPTEAPPSRKQKSSVPTQKSIMNFEEARLRQIHADTQVPSGIQSFLNRLALLGGVPFCYLVPHELMLPPEAIRFFQVDPNWIQALLQGANSIGTTTENDQMHDRVLAAPLQSTLQATSLPVSGLILRSEVVKHWPKLVVVGKKQNGEPAQLLRHAFLADTVLLCLFNATVVSVQIEEPAEGLHFGLDPATAAPHLTKTLKTIEGSGAGKKTSTKAGAPPFRPGGKRVLPIHVSGGGEATLAGNLKQKLASAGIYSDSFTTAEFALEMVAGVEQVIFNNP